MLTAILSYSAIPKQRNSETLLASPSHSKKRLQAARVVHIIPDLTQIGDEERLGLISCFSEPDANGQLHPTSAVLEVDAVVAKDAVIQFGSTSVVNWDTFSQMKSKT